jgi:hypothetical protein
MLGFGAIGRFPLGQVSIGYAQNLTGISATGNAGALTGQVGTFVSLPAVSGTGSAGALVGQQSVNLTGVTATGYVGNILVIVSPPRLITNVSRRLRTLGWQRAAG